MTRYMENDLPRSYWEGKTVLELGAGIGFAGMVAVLLGAGDVALTDGDQKVLERERACPISTLSLFSQSALPIHFNVDRFLPQSRSTAPHLAERCQASTPILAAPH